MVRGFKKTGNIKTKHPKKRKAVSQNPASQTSFGGAGLASLYGRLRTKHKPRVQSVSSVRNRDLKNVKAAELPFQLAAQKAVATHIVPLCKRATKLYNKNGYVNGAAKAAAGIALGLTIFALNATPAPSPNKTTTPTHQATQKIVQAVRPAVKKAPVKRKNLTQS